MAMVMWKSGCDINRRLDKEKKLEGVPTSRVHEHKLHPHRGTSDTAIEGSPYLRHVANSVEEINTCARYC